MPNKYKYNETIDELIEEEDREALNDFYRAQTSYYNTLNNINKIVLEALKEMDSKEIKDVVKGNFKTPVNRI